MFVFLRPLPEGRVEKKKKKNYKQHRKDQLKELLRERNLYYKELQRHSQLA